MLWQFPFKKMCGSQNNLFSFFHRFAIAQEFSRKRKMMACANKLFGKGLCSEVSLGLLKYKFERVRHFHYCPTKISIRPAIIDRVK